MRRPIMKVFDVVGTAEDLDDAVTEWFKKLVERSVQMVEVTSTSLTTSESKGKTRYILVVSCLHDPGGAAYGSK